MRRLEDAELVAIGVGEHVPGGPVFGDGAAGEHGGTERRDPADLGLQVMGSQVEVDPVLALLGVRRPLQEHLDAGTADGHQSPVNPVRAAGGSVAQDSGPEPCRAFQVGAVDHHDEFSVQVRVRLPTHLASLLPGAERRVAAAGLMARGRGEPNPGLLRPGRSSATSWRGTVRVAA
jgi:hypothetical protein